MPQIWLTYDELGALVGRDPAEVRALVAETGRPKRHCSDGLTRVKLSEGMAHDFMLAYAAAISGGQTDLMVSMLRGVVAVSRREQIQAEPDNGSAAAA